MKKNGHDMADKTVAQRRKELQDKLDALDAQVEKEAMDGIAPHLAALSDIGKPHVLITQTEYNGLKAPRSEILPPRTRKPRKAKSTPEALWSAKFDQNKTCAKCNGAVGHSVKSHNLAEGFQDKAFTEDELKKRGYFPPA